MCGLAGFIGDPLGVDERRSTLIDMLNRLRHRGPDHEGLWNEDAVNMGHRRLSILDLSSAGNQPMVSQDGRFVLVFNGEIYNHLDLRKRLQGDGHSQWCGHSDSETLLAGIVAWGVELAVSAAVGMFAIALWDRERKVLTLARDRMGEKPLYYGWQNGVFLFGSELKALATHPAFGFSIDWESVAAFLHRNYVPAPHSIYQGINKLPPGSLLSLSQHDIQLCRLPGIKYYWSLRQVIEDSNEKPFSGTFMEAADELEFMLMRSIAGQCLSDVPVGAFLSGGVDSSLVVSLMQKVNVSSVTTFSIGMPDIRLDETHYALQVSQYLGTRHVQHTISSKEALDAAQLLPKLWDEPLGDSSQLPTYLLSILAKKSVSVALSGDGADELFLGYSQYPLFQKLWRSRALRCLPWDAGFLLIDKINGESRFINKARNVVGAWRQTSPAALSSYWMDFYRGLPFPMADEVNREFSSYPLLAKASASNAGVFDAATYLPDDILTKVDRASMAVSLETRAPFLDHRIVEFALRLPESYKLENGIGKRVLREVLYRHVPRIMVDRPKHGFAVPICQWLKCELRPWAESLLDSLYGFSEVFDQSVIREIWRQHLAGEADNSGRLWGLLVLSQFLNERANE